MQGDLTHSLMRQAIDVVVADDPPAETWTLLEDARLAGCRVWASSTSTAARAELGADIHVRLAADHRVELITEADVPMFWRSNRRDISTPVPTQPDGRRRLKHELLDQFLEQKSRGCDTLSKSSTCGEGPGGYDVAIWDRSRRARPGTPSGVLEGHRSREARLGTRRQRARRRGIQLELISRRKSGTGSPPPQ